MVGKPYPKYKAVETALGDRDFVDDMHFDGMVHGALKFSDHPRAKIINIDTSKAEKADWRNQNFYCKGYPGGTIYRTDFSGLATDGK